MNKKDIEVGDLVCDRYGVYAVVISLSQTINKAFWFDQKKILLSSKKRYPLCLIQKVKK